MNTEESEYRTGKEAGRGASSPYPADKVNNQASPADSREAGRCDVMSMPKIEFISLREKKIITVSACSGKDNRFAKRRDDSRPVKEDGTGRGTWDTGRSEYGISCVDENLLKNYVENGKKQLKIKYSYDSAGQVLDRLGLLSGEKLNMAGWYLFSKEKPIKLTMSVYSTDKKNAHRLEEYSGNIIECLDKAVAFISQNLEKSPSYLQDDGVDSRKAFTEGIRETLIYCFTRMKKNTFPFTEIYITPLKVHVHNPGLSAPVHEAELFAKRERDVMVQSPLIASVLRYGRNTDTFGFGYGEILKYYENDINYKFVGNQFGFSLEVLSIGGKREAKYRRLKELKETDRAVFRAVSAADGITKEEIAVAVDRSTVTVARSLTQLKNAGLIYKRGGNKSIRWYAET